MVTGSGYNGAMSSSGRMLIQVEKEIRSVELNPGESFAHAEDRDILMAVAPICLLVPRRHVWPPSSEPCLLSHTAHVSQGKEASCPTGEQRAVVAC